MKIEWTDYGIARKSNITCRKVFFIDIVSYLVGNTSHRGLLALTKPFSIEKRFMCVAWRVHIFFSFHLTISANTHETLPWSWYCLLRTNTLDTEYIVFSDRTTVNQLPTAPYCRVAIAQSGSLLLHMAFSHPQCSKAELAEHFALFKSNAVSCAPENSHVYLNCSQQ